MTVLFIKEIDCSVSSRALSSGDSSTNPKGNAFNNVYSTYWESSLKGSAVIGNAFIGQYFDVKKKIAKIRYINYTANTAISSVKVQYSNDLAIWTTIQTFSVSTTENAVNILVITSPAAGQFYRLIANSSPLGGDVYGWCVREVELYPSCCETDGGGTCGITMEDQGLPQNVSFKYVDDSSNIIPKLTSYTNGLVTVSASSEYWNNNVNDIVQNAWQAFDKSVNQTGYHEWISDYKTQTLPQWLRIDYGVNTIIAGYWIEMDSNTNRLAKAPKTWQFQGSNDNSTWTTLDTRTNITWTTAERKKFSLSQLSNYRYYRLYVTSSADNLGVTICEFGMFSPIEEAGKSLIPILTGYTGGGVTVSSSSHYWAEEYSGNIEQDQRWVAWKAFDGITTGTFPWLSDPKLQTMPQWLKVDFGSQKQAVGYWIHMDSTHYTHAPKDWQFQGSNNNSTWTTLDTQVDITWSPNQKRLFKLSSIPNFRYYRIYITEASNPSWPEQVAISEFGIFNNEIQKIFDNSTATYWQNSAGSLTSWIEYNFSTEYGPNIFVGGIASASNSYGGGLFPPSAAFDGNYLSTLWETYEHVVSWLRYDLPSAKVLAKYEIYYSHPTNMNSAPKTWTFEGSNDGTNWTVLDTQINQVDWIAGLINVKEYIIPIQNRNSYTKYRINISENNGHRDNAIYELKGYEAYGTTYKKIINGYSLICFNSTYNYQTKTPKSWLFEGSSDGLTWVTLDTRDNETTWQNLEKRKYFFENSTQYSKYRLRITGNNGASDYTIWEMEMYSVDWTKCNIVDEEIGTGTVTPPGPPVGSDVSNLDIIYATDFNELKQYVNQRASESGEVDPIGTPNIEIGNKVTASFMNEIISKHNALVNRSVQQDLELENVTIGEIITAEKYNNVRSSLHNMTFFSYEFIMTAWSPCSKSCGEGTQTRTVLCRRNDGKIEDDYSPCLAAGLSLPDVSIPCMGTECSSCAYLHPSFLTTAQSTYLSSHPELYVNQATKFRHLNGDCYYSFWYSKTSRVGIGEWKPCPYTCKRWNFGTRPIVIYQLPHGNNLTQGAQYVDGSWSAFVTCWVDEINFDPNNIQGVYPSWTVDHGLYQTGYQGVGC